MNDNDHILILQSNLSELTRLADYIDAFCHMHGLGSEAAATINIVLDELCTNVITHAFEDDMVHDLVVRLHFHEGTFTGEVEDDGREFNPLDVRSPDIELPLEERPIGGLGIHLVRNLMDDVRYERRGGKNFVTVYKKLPARG